MLLLMYFVTFSYNDISSAGNFNSDNASFIIFSSIELSLSLSVFYVNFTNRIKSLPFKGVKQYISDQKCNLEWVSHNDNKSENNNFSFQLIYCYF